MADSGKKKKPLSLVGGRDKQVDEQQPVQRREGKIVPPKKLIKRRQKIWDDYIEPAWWLQQGDALLAFMFVNLFDEYMQKPQEMIASRIAELRRCQGELHLTSSEQARLGINGAESDPAEKYFR